MRRAAPVADVAPAPEARKGHEHRLCSGAASLGRRLSAATVLYHRRPRGRRPRRRASRAAARGSASRRRARGGARRRRGLPWQIMQCFPRERKRVSTPTWSSQANAGAAREIASAHSQSSTPSKSGLASARAGRALLTGVARRALGFVVLRGRWPQARLEIGYCRALPMHRALA